MSETTKNPDFFETQIFGHPAGLFVLFFTEMWERFSFYGMRVLLVNFLTMAVVGYNPGWAWTAENATALFGTYAMLLYLTPILGGIIADKLTGYRWAVVIGAAIMTLGHASMALETELSLYAGLALLVLGTGFFKPNITSIISEMYKELPEKKDGAYTIFYMGVNAGAFFGMMLCGYLAERIGWSWGFGLAGIFMLLGTLQFWFAKPLFGHIGDVPSKQPQVAVAEAVASADDEEGTNPFTMLDKILIVICTVLGLGYAIGDPLSAIANINLFSALDNGVLDGKYVAALTGLVIFLILVISRIVRYPKIVRDRMIAVVIFAFFTVFFWMSFEQGATSLVLFARDNVDRVLSGNSAVIYNIVNALLTIVPLAFITYVLYLLGKRTYKQIPGSNIVLIVCFLGIWGIVGWMLNRDFQTVAYDVTYKAIKTSAISDSYNIDESQLKSFKGKMLGGNFLAENETEKDKPLKITVDSITYQGNVIKYKNSELKEKEEKKAEQKEFDDAYLTSVLAIQNSLNPIVYYTKEKKKGEEKGGVGNIALSKLYFETTVTEQTKINDKFILVDKTVSVAEQVTLTVGQEVKIITKDNEGETFGYLDEERLAAAISRGEELKIDNGVVAATVSKIKDSEVEITVSWFSILNSFFIIVFASFFSKWWDSKYNPSAAVKYGLGLIVMAVGFGLLAYGAYGITEGVKVSMIWLILAYLFHTLGELCLSPVGLSYVSKLVPARMIAFMFGMWYLAIAIGNKLAAVFGGQIENITEQYDLSTFFLIFTIVPTVAGILIIILNPLLKKLMHGVR